ncbi:MAG TPA: hypothetical protein DDW50_16960, partial [Firmicutes bacterium]|nr:hypothetical protein [Bacillota bacterium]
MSIYNQSKSLLNESIRMEIADSVHEQGPILTYELQGILVYCNECPPELLQALEGWFRDHGIVPHRMNEEFIQNPSCFDELKNQTRQSILGVVVLDGLSPFIPFELGFVKGSGLSVIAVNSAKAQVNIKAFYHLAEESGLETAVFEEQLTNPPFHTKNQLPEFERSGITRISLNKSDVGKLQSVLGPALENCCEKIGAKVVDKIGPELFGVSSSFIKEKLGEIFQRLMQIYLFSPIDCLTELQEIYQRFKEFSVQNNELLPEKLVSLIAAAALRSHTDQERPVQEGIASTVHFAGDICRDFLHSTAFQQNPDARTIVLKTAGCSELILAGLSEPVAHCREAINLFKEALRNAGPDTQDPVCQINLGIAYLKMAFQNEEALNCRLSIEAFTS